MELHASADVRMYHKLCALNITENMFDVQHNNLRSGSNIRSVAVARTERVNNIFSFRVTRMLR